MFNFKYLYILAVLGAILAGAACRLLAANPMPFMIIFLFMSGIEAAPDDGALRDNDRDREPYTETRIS
jgi:hypothetical protein